MSKARRALSRPPAGVFALAVWTPAEGPLALREALRFRTEEDARSKRPHSILVWDGDQLWERAPPQALDRLGALLEVPISPAGRRAWAAEIWAAMGALPWTAEDPGPIYPVHRGGRRDQHFLYSCVDKEAKRSAKLVMEGPTRRAARAARAAYGGRAVVSPGPRLPPRCDDPAERAVVEALVASGGEAWLEDLLRWGCDRDAIVRMAAAAWLRCRPENGWLDPGRPKVPRPVNRPPRPGG